MQYAPPGLFLPSFGHTTPAVQLAQNADQFLQTSGWPIRSVVVNNPAPFFIQFLEYAGSWVTPWTFGATIALPSARSLIRVTSKNVPTGYPANPSTALLATLVGYEDALPPSPGVVSIPSVPKNQIINTTQAQSTTAHLIAAVAGQVITLYYLSLMLAIGGAGNGGVTFQSSATNVAAANYATNLTTYQSGPSVSWPLGFPLPVGEGLDMVTAAGQSVLMNGSVVFVQA